MRAEADLQADLVQRRRAIQVLGNIAAGMLDQLHLRLADRRLARVTAAAGAKPGLLSGLG